MDEEEKYSCSTSARDTVVCEYLLYLSGPELHDFGGDDIYLLRSQMNFSAACFGKMQSWELRQEGLDLELDTQMSQKEGEGKRNVRHVA